MHRICRTPAGAAGGLQQRRPRKAGAASQSGPQPGKAGRDRPIVIMLDLATVAKTPVRWGNTKRAKKSGIANSSPFALSDRERGQYEVYMTRNEDIFIPLQVRVAKARNSVLTCLSLSMPTPLPVVTERFLCVCALNQRCNQYCGKYLAQTQNASDLIGGVSKSGDAMSTTPCSIWCSR